MMSQQSTFNNRLIINEVSQRPGIPDRQNAIEILTKTMNAIGGFCRDTLQKGIGINVPGFGYGFYVNQFDKKQNKGLRELHFAFDEKFTKPLNLKAPIDQQLTTYQAASMPLGDKHGPIHRLNFVVIGQSAGYDYQDCMEGFQLFMAEFSRIVRTGMDGTVDFSFGKLSIKNYSAKFTFDSALVQQIQSAGVLENIKTSQVLTGGSTFRPCDHFKPEQIIYK
ncbi:Conserved_hypothetical protein [Hexamita inflata]|uniref:CCDC81 HU domain-containing protein n=1 Tax=Hexamita inflata TaxID=28002 RepID=A0AA86NTX3_9EUKA|nr:Conserved hypothetical protein [Hexamita inflata]